MTSRVLLILSAVFLITACRGSDISTGPVCGNGVSETGEECDAPDLGEASCTSLRLGSGDLACGDDCSFDVSGCSEQADCGNDVAEYPEECDGADLWDQTCESLGQGYTGGTLACTGQCTLDTSLCEINTDCGNGTREGNEECDGGDLGGATCDSLGLGSGTLGCQQSCRFDTSDCANQQHCGNDNIEYPEVCDGDDLDSQDCTDHGYYTGTLACDVDCSGFVVTGCRGTCGDSVRNGTEVCDGTDVGTATCRSEGFYGGTLGCLTNCSDFDTGQCSGTCGDGIVNGGELCDTNDFGADSCQVRGYYTGNLVCSANCDSVDAGNCAGRCGDDIIQPSFETCDGSNVGVATCQSEYGVDGSLRCLPDCSDYNEASCGLGILINEVALGYPDWVEIINVSNAAVDLGGWTLHWWGIDNGVVSGSLTIPVTPGYLLGPGERVVIDENGPGNPGDPPTIDDVNGVIAFPENIPWSDEPGAVALEDDQGDTADFVRWVDNTFSVPVDTAWADTPDPLPAPNSTTITLSRVPDGIDNDVAGDFCVARATKNGPNNIPCYAPQAAGSVLISEVLTGYSDQDPLDLVELYNPGNSPVELGNLGLYWRVTQGTYGDALPPFTLAGNAVVVVHDDCPDGDPPYVDGTGIHVHNIGLWDDAPGSLWLAVPGIWEGVDFVRWGGSNSDAWAPDTWADTPGALPDVPFTQSLSRAPVADSDTAADWCIQTTPSFGSVNPTCP